MAIKYSAEAPQLRFDQEWQRWVLSLPKYTKSEWDDSDCSYEMVIDVKFRGDEGGWFAYTFVRWSHGEWIEVITQDRYKERIAMIRVMEGDEIAKLWVMEQEQVLVIGDGHPVFALKQHWEAMMQLKLFFPSATHAPWKGIDLNPDTVAKMDAIRERLLRETVEEMAAEQAEQEQLATSEHRHQTALEAAEEDLYPPEHGYDVWYMKPEYFRDGVMGYDFCKTHGKLPDALDLTATHVLLKHEMEADNLDELFRLMQAENWSPDGEGRKLIEEKGLAHTSMSVGDIAVDKDGKVWMADNIGWKVLFAP